MSEIKNQVLHGTAIVNGLEQGWILIAIDSSHVMGALLGTGNTPIDEKWDIKLESEKICIRSSKYSTCLGDDGPLADLQACNSCNNWFDMEPTSNPDEFYIKKPGSSPGDSLYLTIHNPDGLSLETTIGFEEQGKTPKKKQTQKWRYDDAIGDDNTKSGQ